MLAGRVVYEDDGSAVTNACVELRVVALGWEPITMRAYRTYATTTTRADGTFALWAAGVPRWRRMWLSIHGKPRLRHAGGRQFIESVFDMDDRVDLRNPNVIRVPGDFAPISRPLAPEELYRMLEGLP